MLSEYEGPANSPEMLPHLVGEEIKAAFQDGHYLIQVLSSGTALVLTSFGGRQLPVMGKENEQDTLNRINRRRREIDRMSDELKGLEQDSNVYPTCS